MTLHAYSGSAREQATEVGRTLALIADNLTSSAAETKTDQSGETKKDQTTLGVLDLLGFRPLALKCARVIVPGCEVVPEFECVFARHGGHRATLHWDESGPRATGQLKYHCWARGEEAAGWHTLAEAFARSRGRPARLGNLEARIWWAKLGIKAGLVTVPSIPALPQGLDPATRGVAIGFSEFWGIRQALGAVGPAPFASRFAAAFCETPRLLVLKAMRTLNAEGVLIRVDAPSDARVDRRTPWFVPGAAFQERWSGGQPQQQTAIGK